eukprot:9102004-Pyramimonas_sp.AAC.1
MRAPRRKGANLPSALQTPCLRVDPSEGRRKGRGAAKMRATKGANGADAANPGETAPRLSPRLGRPRPPGPLLARPPHAMQRRRLGAAAGSPERGRC